MKPTIYQVAFASIKGITIDIANEILSIVGSEEEFFRISEKELQTTTQLTPRLLKKDYRDALLIDAEITIEESERKHVGMHYYRQDSFPTRFQTVPDAPLLIYSAGNCDLNSAKIVSIVGTRHSTAYGMDLCKSFVGGLKDKVGNDVVVVSGLAYGIDITAHRAALSCGLPTIAVVAHGLDTIYPAAHRGDAIEIVRSGGAILSEYKFSTKVHRSNFLARNRLIAAMADCTIVMESAFKGGALVTANVALNYGRDVFAFPGRIGDEYSEGCNKLIKKNVASLITSVDDVIDAMGWEKKKDGPVELELFPQLSSEEQKIYDIISDRETVNVNALAGNVGMPFHRILSTLIDLEFRGIVRALPGNQYALNKKINL